jgi:DNA-binding transcriptional LysR family regulator
MIGRFYEQYPFISVILTVAGTGEIEEMVANGDLELGIVGADDFNKDIEARKS